MGPSTGPLRGLDEVGHSQGEPVGVLGSWTGAQCGQAPSRPATPNACLTPLQAPYTPAVP